MYLMLITDLSERWCIYNVTLQQQQNTPYSVITHYRSFSSLPSDHTGTFNPPSD